MAFPVLVISLARHKERLHRLYTSLAEMQLDTSAIVVDAIDGNLLKLQVGRARHLGGGKMRMCWNSSEHFARLGRDGQSEAALAFQMRMRGRSN